MQNYFKINKQDTVAVALSALKKGDTLKIENAQITLCNNIPAGHKFALSFIKKDEQIIKYGHKIGYATQDINIGEHVHIHNLKTSLSDNINYKYEKVEASRESNDKAIYFNGYKRDNGTVGIRNEIWIIPTVGCVNNVAKQIEKMASIANEHRADDIVAFNHPFGCSQMGQDQENTIKILSNLINHPNAGGVLVLGLGCENCNIGEFKKVLGEVNDERVKFLQCQDYDDELAEGVKLIDELCKYTQKFERESIDAKNLIVGLKCGGSDGFSGITANPTVGEFSDILINHRGTTILTEVPEMFGAETILMNRCKNEEVFNKTVALINDFKQYFISHNQTIYENPSPGNKQGGISTLEDKSLGCTQKSGTAEIVDVLKYGDIVCEKGLNLLNAPGNDLVAATALAAAGAHIVLFTTGRGTPFACPVPTVKISSNTPLSNKKNNWVDFDCGVIISNGDTIGQTANSLFEYVMNVANGEKVKAEKMGYHDLAIFKQGVTL